MRSIHSDSLVVFLLFPIFLAGAVPFLLMGFLGIAGIGLFGLLLMSSALTVGLDADTEFKAQAVIGRRTEGVIQSSTRDAMVRFATAAGGAGAMLVAIAVGGLVWGR